MTSLGFNESTALTAANKAGMAAYKSASASFLATLIYSSFSLQAFSTLLHSFLLISPSFFYLSKSTSNLLTLSVFSFKIFCLSYSSIPIALTLMAESSILSNPILNEDPYSSSS